MVKWLVSILFLCTTVISYAQLNCSDTRYNNPKLKDQCSALNTGNDSVTQARKNYVQDFSDAQFKYLATLNGGLPANNNLPMTSSMTNKAKNNPPVVDTMANTPTAASTEETDKKSTTRNTIKSGPNWTY